MGWVDDVPTPYYTSPGVTTAGRDTGPRLKGQRLIKYISTSAPVLLTNLSPAALSVVTERAQRRLGRSLGGGNVGPHQLCKWPVHLSALRFCLSKHYGYTIMNSKGRSMRAAELGGTRVSMCLNRRKIITGAEWVIYGGERRNAQWAVGGTWIKKCGPLSKITVYCESIILDTCDDNKLRQEQQPSNKTEETFCGFFPLHLLSTRN